MRLPLQESAYHPHGVCYLWEPGLVWTHVTSDALIALAYFSIPFGLVYFLRKRRDIPFNRMIGAFALFILACGATHAMAIWTLWRPDFWAAAWVKVVTAVASVSTAALLVPFVPKALRFPSIAQWEERNRALERQIEERREVERKLQASNEELDGFAYTVSHDLRAPLRAMEGFAVALLEDCTADLSPECVDYAERIRASANRMEELIRDLLEYSRLVRAEVAREPVDLSVTVRDVLDAMTDVDTESHVTVEIADETLVLAREAILRHMIENLVRNALTYTREGETPAASVRSERCGDRVRIWVEDRGIGIAPEHHERIFNVFERLHSIETYPGTGIGLAIVAKGSERLGGTCGVESAVGEGSRFWFELEAAP